ncbi:MAG TPA: alcohol dehydrogenase catalytic domain-containing protein, partial [Solirubrobacteraceae bacterium]|nr:alcohol dehydrogenase catalytic domain-containing protein [Solirubrobacteraceae bacterium]
VRLAAATLSPMAAAASRVALERDAGLRARRLRAAAGDRVRQRLHPTRPRMRALVAAPGGRLAWRDAPAPRVPGPDGAVVHPIAVATCDLDRALVLGATPFALPLHFGHECVADVLATGERVRTVRPGDRVVVPFQISCGACSACAAGRTANCRSVPPLSMYGFGVGGGHWGGAVSDELAVPFADAMLVPLPAGLDPAAAASVADNVSDAHRHVAPYLPALLRRDPDAAVLIVAAQRRRSLFSPSVALYAGLVARALGARHVRLVDARAGVRAHAERLGLEALPPAELRGLAPAPLTIDAGASPRALRAALSATAPDGVCTSAGGLHRTARIPTGLLYGRNATYHVGRSHARAGIPAVLELMADGRLRPEQVTTCLAPIDDAPRALGEHVRGDGTKTILVEPGARAAAG